MQRRPMRLSCTASIPCRVVCRSPSCESPAHLLVLLTRTSSSGSPAHLQRDHLPAALPTTQAERVRVGACDGAAFSALLTHLTVGCKPQQLASDVAFLQQELRAAEQQLRHVRASLLRRMGDVVAAIAGPLLDQQLPDWQQEPGTQQGPKCSPSPRSEERPDVGHKGEGERLQSLGEAPQACAASRQQSVGRTEAMEEVGGTAPAESAGGDGEMQLARAVAVLAGGAAASGEARLGAVEALCTVLSGAAAEPAAQVGHFQL